MRTENGWQGVRRKLFCVLLGKSCIRGAFPISQARKLKMKKKKKASTRLQRGNSHFWDQICSWYKATDFKQITLQRPFYSSKLMLCIKFVLYCSSFKRTAHKNWLQKSDTFSFLHNRIRQRGACRHQNACCHFLWCSPGCLSYFAKYTYSLSHTHTLF